MTVTNYTFSNIYQHTVFQYSSLSYENVSPNTEVPMTAMLVILGLKKLKPRK